MKLQNSLVLTNGRFSGFSPEDIKNWIKSNHDSKALAEIYEAVNLKSSWVGDCLDDPDYDDDLWLKYAYEEWSETEYLILDQIIRFITEGQVENHEYYVSRKIPLIRVIAPFMVKNGYDYYENWVINDKCYA